ncbi:hypothetical protein ASPCAL10838 [Aspergillus calidoustus]|uniref:Uncharacterized protein n=1 Tax=Aspergillus calidoustus TaxID=454130 RepID=A0A0U5G6D8_ASPCI|nr:hypothetical protein ASPCAL10838 [Aspergillus calidoustus]
MDTNIEAASSLDDFNPQSLDPEELEKTLTTLKQRLLKTEAAKLLLPAKEFPFPRGALGRLSNLLNLVFKSEKRHEPKLAAIRELDPVSLIICGLCLTQKAVDIMRKELFDVLLEQAIIASQAMVKIIMKSEEINKVVLTSSVDEDFLNSKYSARSHPEDANKTTDYGSLRRGVNGSIRPSLQYSLNGSPSWCYSKIIKQEPGQTMFPRLLTKSARGYVTAFLPSEESTDGLIRVMTMFDQTILRMLFGCAETGTMAAGRLLRLSQVNMR